MARFRRRKRRRQAPSAEINLTPLIDTALTLLIMFMLTAPMMHNAIKVELPNGKVQEVSGPQNELVVHLDKKNTLFFNGERVDDTKQLLERLKKAVGTDTQKTVFVKADQAVNYGSVIELVDQIKVVGGVRYVALATQKVV